MSQPTKPILAALPLLLVAGCGASGTESRVAEATGVFATEREAASAGSINRPVPKPVAQLAVGESVTVLSDTYGKDYWACKVRTKDSVSGWVLCTSLNYRRDGGA
jgi:hypothetical protein